MSNLSEILPVIVEGSADALAVAALAFTALVGMYVFQILRGPVDTIKRNGATYELDADYQKKFIYDVWNSPEMERNTSPFIAAERAA